MADAQKNMTIIFLVIFSYKVVCVDNKFSKKLVFYGEKKMLFTDLLKQFLKSMIIVRG